MQPTGQETSKLVTASNQHRVYSIAFADDGKYVLSGGVEGVVRRWRADNGRELDSKSISTNGRKIYVIAVSPDHKWLVCGLKFPEGSGNTEEARVVAWDALTQEKILDIHGHSETVLSMHISSDSSKLVTGGSDKMAFVRSLTTGERLAGPLFHDGWVVAVRFSPNGSCIATATAENPDGHAKSIRVYDSGSGQRLLNISFQAKPIVSSPLVWSADGRQLFAVSYGEARCFDASSGSLQSRWSVPGKGQPTSIVLSRSGKFIAISSHDTLSFWDAFTYQPIGAVIKHAAWIWSIALSPDDESIATSEENGIITFRNLRCTLPDSYFSIKVSDQLGYTDKSETFIYLATLLLSHPLKLPFMHIDGAALTSWTQGDLVRVEKLLTEGVAQTIHDRPLHHSCALALRALVRIRLKQWSLAVDDVKKSIETQRSVIGHIANALTYVGNRDYDSALRIFDVVFTEGLATENNLLLLIKAIILFECGQHNNAISRIGDLTDVLDDRSLCIAVRAQMFLLLGRALLKGGDSKQAMELLRRAREAIPLPKHPHLLVISLIFGWKFDEFDLAVRQQLQECLKLFEGYGDTAMSKDPDEAILRYSTALSLSPPNPSSILVNRSKAFATLERWEDALKDADEAIKIDPQSPWGFKRKHAALHGLRRYGEAIDAFSHMLSLIDASPDPDSRQLGKKYISPARSETEIENAVRGVFRISPLVLIDVQSGRLCNETQRMHTFKSELQFKELVSSMTRVLDDGRIQSVVKRYFLYVMFSHVWEGDEPSFQDVNLFGSVWNLDSSLLNKKLRKFCEVARDNGYRWAWSDTCCIDKTISTVLYSSLMMMYKWYEASAATFVYLKDVELLSILVRLRDSVWMTRAWTSQELLAPKAIRFYDRNWKPYLGDTRSNHKESLEIMQELADAIGVTRQIITSFNPNNLSVREKLRLASTRNATKDEDIAYSLIGIFKSDIIPRYGEGDAALGHLLEEIVTRSGEVMVLSWSGKSSSYNSCLPATLAVYNQPPSTSPAIDDNEMAARVSVSKELLSETDVTEFHKGVNHLLPARFANRRLSLPCIIFGIKRLGIQKLESDTNNEIQYRARVSGIGDVEFQTSDRLELTEPRKLILVHPWIRDLRDPLDGFTWGSETDDEASDSEPEAESVEQMASPLHARPVPTMDDYTRALRLVVRLQQPFHALLLRQEPTGEFKRVAAEHEIVVPGIESQINFAKDVRTKIVEIL